MPFDFPFIIAKKFIGNQPICLNLGDHIFFGNDVISLFKKNINNFQKSTIFAYEKRNRNLDYGLIVTADANYDLDLDVLDVVILVQEILD